MADIFVTLATYRFPQKAELAKVLLAHEGIEANVNDGNTVNADWFLGNAIGYAKLQVPSSQVKLAIEILESHPELLDSGSQEPSIDAPDVCLACGATLPTEGDGCSICGWSYLSDDDNENLAANDTPES